jgi:RNA polymerase sigma-70 factor (ECF subfamily)
MSWLVRLARNRAIDRLRARRVREATSGPSLDESTAEPAAAGSAIRTPEAIVVDDERRGKVIDALASIPPEQRHLIEAAFFEGYTHSELAKRFGLPLGTVKTRIRTGMIAMRQRLEHAV